MEKFRVRFIAVRRSDKGIALRVQLTQNGRPVTGEVLVTNPGDLMAPMMYTESVLGSAQWANWATMAALDGPLKAALSLQVGGQMPADFEAVITEDPPPSPGYTAFRVSWSHDPDERGIIVTLKPRS